ncbi:MAG TPA: 2-oxoglutarate and iron-dependent oxygenase domain-containing protein [Casimicrobiaceae bacterium]|nr:2-oxoglutarate and iron-dependent oxygenase domain-containing protein [Casimicrobiaceae bacterium]
MNTWSNHVIPGLDLGPYSRGEPGALDDLAQKLRWTCENVGFFYIENHGVPESLIERTFAASRRVHAMPVEQKREIRLNEQNIGYLMVNESIQGHSKVEKARKPNYNESFFCMRDRRPDDPDVLARKPFKGLNQWPRDLPGFREDCIAYMKALDDLGMRMLPVVARALDLPLDFFSDYFNPANLQLRLLHYPVRDESEPDQYGAGAHTDAGFLTFLMQHGVGGLQIRQADGTWFDAPVLPGKYLINTGDLLRRWTNDRWLSTPHRVMNVSGTDRYSIAFFFGPDLERKLSCLPTCHDAEHPPKYPPISYGEYKLEFVSANYFKVDHSQAAADRVTTHG